MDRLGQHPVDPGRSSSPLRGAATVPETGRRPVCKPSSSPLRGAATGDRGTRSSPVHRSSSPLRGAATRVGIRGRSGADRVIIAPTRGSNTMAGLDPAVAQQSSSPLRGAATRSAGPSPPWSRRSSSPLRGAATRNHGYDDLTSGPVIIAPTRGSNQDPPALVRCPRGRHHRPYEGQQPVSRGRSTTTGPASHHRPYEGQQHDQAEREHAPGRVIIAPTRGSNVKTWPAAAARASSSSPLRGAATRCRSYRRSPDRSVIIAPTRGSNAEMMLAALAMSVVIIAPTRGSNMS